MSTSVAGAKSGSGESGPSYVFNVYKSAKEEVKAFADSAFTLVQDFDLKTYLIAASRDSVETSAFAPMVLAALGAAMLPLSSPLVLGALAVGCEKAISGIRHYGEVSLAGTAEFERLCHQALYTLGVDVASGMTGATIAGFMGTALGSICGKAAMAQAGRTAALCAEWVGTQTGTTLGFHSIHAAQTAVIQEASFADQWLDGTQALQSAGYIAVGRGAHAFVTPWFRHNAFNELQKRTYTWMFGNLFGSVGSCGISAVFGEAGFARLDQASAGGSCLGKVWAWAEDLAEYVALDTRSGALLDGSMIAGAALLRPLVNRATAGYARLRVDAPDTHDKRECITIEPQDSDAIRGTIIVSQDYGQKTLSSDPWMMAKVSEGYRVISYDHPSHFSDFNKDIAANMERVIGSVVTDPDYRRQPVFLAANGMAAQAVATLALQQSKVLNQLSGIIAFSPNLESAAYVSPLEKLTMAPAGAAITANHQWIRETIDNDEFELSIYRPPLLALHAEDDAISLRSATDYYLPRLYGEKLHYLPLTEGGHSIVHDSRVKDYVDRRTSEFLADPGRFCGDGYRKKAWESDQVLPGVRLDPRTQLHAVVTMVKELFAGTFAREASAREAAHRGRINYAPLAGIPDSFKEVQVAYEVEHGAMLIELDQIGAHISEMMQAEPLSGAKQRALAVIQDQFGGNALTQNPFEWFIDKIVTSRQALQRDYAAFYERECENRPSFAAVENADFHLRETIHASDDLLTLLQIDRGHERWLFDQVDMIALYRRWQQAKDRDAESLREQMVHTLKAHMVDQLETHYHDLRRCSWWQSRHLKKLRVALDQWEGQALAARGQDPFTLLDDVPDRGDFVFTLPGERQVEDVLKMAPLWELQDRVDAELRFFQDAQRRYFIERTPERLAMTQRRFLQRIHEMTHEHHWQLFYHQFLLEIAREKNANPALIAGLEADLTDYHHEMEAMISCYRDSISLLDPESQAAKNGDVTPFVVAKVAKRPLYRLTGDMMIKTQELHRSLGLPHPYGYSAIFPVQTRLLDNAADPKCRPNYYANYLRAVADDAFGNLARGAGRVLDIPSGRIATTYYLYLRPLLGWKDSGVRLVDRPDLHAKYKDFGEAGIQALFEEADMRVDAASGRFFGVNPDAHPYPYKKNPSVNLEPHNSQVNIADAKPWVPLYQKTVGRMPILGPVAQALSNLELDRNHAREAKAATAHALSSGSSVRVYPEGTRNILGAGDLRVDYTKHRYGGVIAPPDLNVGIASTSFWSELGDVAYVPTVSNAASLLRSADGWSSTALGTVMSGGDTVLLNRSDPLAYRSPRGGKMKMAIGEPFYRRAMLDEDSAIQKLAAFEVGARRLIPDDTVALYRAMKATFNGIARQYPEYQAGPYVLHHANDWKNMWYSLKKENKRRYEDWEQAFLGICREAGMEDAHVNALRDIRRVMTAANYAHVSNEWGMTAMRGGI